jgi:hypothetical protein
MYTQIVQRDQKRKFVFAVNKILLMMIVGYWQNISR